MTAETIKELNEAEGTINIDIHGLEPRVKVNFLYSSYRRHK